MHDLLQIYCRVGAEMIEKKRLNNLNFLKNGDLNILYDSGQEE